MKLSIVVPMFNEELFISDLLSRLTSVSNSLQCEVEVLVVDDGSTDKSAEIVRNLNLQEVQLIQLENNVGKGAAVRQGIFQCTGDLVLVQDADLEYDPGDIRLLMEPYLSRDFNQIAVYGSRVKGAKVNLKSWRRILGIWPSQGLPQWGFNYFLSAFLYVLTRCWITDLLTGYKIYPRSLFNTWQSSTMGFETDHEITMRLLKVGIQIIEVPVSYVPRTKEMGKKIQGRDAFKAIKTIWRFRK